MTKEKYLAARKVLLDFVASTAQEKGITQEEIARRTGFTQSNVSRMLSGRYPPSLDNFMKLCEAVDLYIFIEPKSSDSDLATLMRNRHRRKGDTN
jgi:transcriptional regulator with XRE-family HTH domain